MTREQVIALFNRERDYEELAFGSYKQIPALSFPSFIIFLKDYVDKAEKAYTGKWEKELPPWLKSCSERELSGSPEGGTAPVKAYEEVIKIMALAGAALETYAQIDASKWREDPEKESQKWKE